MMNREWALFFAASFWLLCNGAPCKGDGSTFAPTLRTGRCLGAVGTNDDETWPVSCINGSIESSLMTSSGRRRPAQWHNWAEVYFGGHLSSVISGHGVAEFSHVGRWSDAATRHESMRRTRNLFLQVGNGAVGHWQASIGKVDLPFGLNTRNLPHAYYETYVSDIFWRSPQYGLRLGFDNAADLQIDIGIGGSTAATIELPPSLTEQASAVRVAYDIPALGGTRFLLSAMDHSTEERKLGAALINMGTDQAATSIEWVRLRMPKDAVRPMEQLTRLSMRSQENQGRSVLFELEDHFRIHWLTTVSYDQQLWQHLSLRTAVSFRRARLSDETSQWIFAAAIKGQL